jgi:predicted HNH restriction endonuclease
MGWVKFGDGLKLVGKIHYNEEDINQLIIKLGSKKRGHPERVCSQLKEFLDSKIVSKDLIWRLSKWCDWSDKSKEIAIEISKILFFDIVCRRLRDQNNRPIPDAYTANMDYDNWINSVIEVGNSKTQSTVYPDEIDEDKNYYEGTKKTVNINIHERNKDARKKCIEHYGAKCIICGFNFNETYEGIGEGFIHVHHIKPLSEINEEYKVDPINDLRPVCPNCHVVIHKFKEPYSIAEVKNMLKIK